MREADLVSWLPFFLQTSDALFPTGAYAHSLGFEEIVRLGIVKNEATLGDFLLGNVLPSLTALELPYLRFAFEGASWETLEPEISAWKLPHESRQASVQLGLRRLKALQAVCADPGRIGSEPESLDDFFGKYAKAVAEGRAVGHNLVVCALQARLEAVPLDAALIVYGYQSLSATCGAALKLLRLGQDGCQRALRKAAARLPEAARLSMDVRRDDAGVFDPLLEIAAMRHEFAGERLFIS